MIIFFNKKINTFSKFNKKNLQITQQMLQDLMPISDDIHCNCPKCGAKDNFSYHGSYKRNFTFLDQDCLHNVILTVTRVICNSCGQTHACLPNFIIPYKIISRDTILSFVFQSSHTTVLKVAEKLQISFQLIYYYLDIFMSFFAQVDLLNNEKNFTKNFNKKYFTQNCIKLCNDEFMRQYFLHYNWIFLMTKFRNTTSPPIHIGLI